MASEKKFPLSIIIRTVDKATAGIQRINQRLEHLSKPFSGLHSAMSKLGETSGAHRIGESFKHLKETLGGVLEKLLMIVGAEGLLGIVLERMVEHFTNLGHSAERIGITADSLAQFRFAAEMSGAKVEDLDSGMLEFAKNLEKARLGQGRFAALLKQASPVFLAQLKHTKNYGEAFDLMAQAMAQIKDPAKRATLAMAAFGGPALIPMMARGSKGIQELKDRYKQLAGSQEGAVEASLKLHESFLELGAVTDGLKAAIVEGLGPTILDLIKRLTAFIVENRSKIIAWIETFARWLPGAVVTVGNAVSGLISFISTVVNALGGFKTIAIALAVMLGGKLLVAIYAFGAALLSTPLGWVLAGIAAITAAVAVLITQWEKAVTAVGKLKVAMGFLIGGGGGLMGRGGGKLQEAVRLFEKPEMPSSQLLRMNLAGPAQAQIKVDFANAPTGTRVTANPRNTADVDFSVGYQMVLP